VTTPDQPPTPTSDLPQLPPRPATMHKGQAGHVAVIAGSRGMSGAAVLAGLGALRCGAGLVRVLTPESVQPVVAAAEPGLIGVPLLADIAPQISEVLGALRDRLPRVPRVLGGPTATAWPARSLELLADADFTVAGEGEAPLVRLAAALEAGQDPAGIPGLSWREDGVIRSAAPAPPERDADRFPPPARDLLAAEYRAQRYYYLLVRERPTETLVSSRGCPHRCAFCYSTIRRYRPRSPASVLDELVAIRSRGIRHVELVDDNFTRDRDRALHIFRALAGERLGLRLVIKSRVDAVDAELLAAARAAGVYQVSYGMESGVQAMLDRMRKGTTVQDNARANRLTQAAGLKSHTAWFFGFPGETPETIATTIDFVVRLRPDSANFMVFRPYPGTPAYEEARDAGTLVGDWGPRMTHFPWVRLPWMHARADLEAAVRRANRRLYVHPHYAVAFGRDILREANWTMARYAWQEARRLLPGFGGGR